MSGELESKRQAVAGALRRAAGDGRLAVAFSGGVDSTLLLALACQALGPARVVAITARSESLAGDELALCRRTAARLEVELVLVRTRELARAGYQANGPDRCYHCKSELFEAIEDEVLAAHGVTAVAYGATADDLGDHRPGMTAAQEHHVLAPLADAGLSKAEIRALSQDQGLETWDKPAQPCLASRIPYGQQVTAGKLGQIEAGERLLRELGLRELRLRHHDQPGGPLARIEVAPADLPRLVTPGVREPLTAGLRALGFAYVTIDLEGFRSGRLNEALGASDLSTRKLPTV